jgi:hypothetical protein
MGIIKKYHDKNWTLQFLDALYNSIDKSNIAFIRVHGFYTHLALGILHTITIFN